MNISQQVLERLDSKGWQQKQVGTSLGPNCLMGALGWTLGSLSWSPDVASPESRVLHLWRDIIMEQFPERTTDLASAVVRFNDHPDTTIADVCVVLEKASAIEDERISASDHEALNGRSMASLT